VNSAQAGFCYQFAVSQIKEGWCFMELVTYGRKTFSFAGGKVMLTSTSVTEKPLPGEGETVFTDRLIAKYRGQQGTIEIVIKNGYPDYAIITFSQSSVTS
jgi:hypothetical protein